DGDTMHRPVRALPDDRLSQSAANMAAWHATSAEALGCPSVWWSGGWAARERIPAMYLNAIVWAGELPPGEQVERLRGVFARGIETGVPIIVLDATNALDLTPLGLERRAAKPSFWRAANPCLEVPLTTELDVVEV